MYIRKENLCAWAYARDDSTSHGILICQMVELLGDAERRGIQTAGASQDMSSGKTLDRMGLKEALRAVRTGHANAVLVRDVSRISGDKHTLLRVMEILQDHGAVLLCTKEDAYASLRAKGVSQQIYQGSFCMDVDLPWLEKSRNGG